MLRVRFRANAEDFRPVNWPVKHPFWCTGYGGDFEYSIVVSYADDLDYIRENWPEARSIEFEYADEYLFTGRFPKPEWFDENDDSKKDEV